MVSPTGWDPAMMVAALSSSRTGKQIHDILACVAADNKKLMQMAPVCDEVGRTDLVPYEETRKQIPGMRIQESVGGHA